MKVKEIGPRDRRGIPSVPIGSANAEDPERLLMVIDREFECGPELRIQHRGILTGA